MPTTKGRFANEPLEQLILSVRGHRVILDADLARLYGVTTRVLNPDPTKTGWLNIVFAASCKGEQRKDGDGALSPAVGFQFKKAALRGFQGKPLAETCRALTMSDRG